MLVDIETPATRLLMEKETIDILRKNLTFRFKSLLTLKAKKVDKDKALNVQSQCNSTQDKQQLIMTSYTENPFSSPDQEEQESRS